MPDIFWEVRDGLGLVELQRPKAINALSVAMIRDLARVFSQWAADDAVSQVELRGAGERGFCSGADVRELRELALQDPRLATGFLAAEYELDRMIAEYPKPVTAHLFGISMGGGLGLAGHAARRIGAVDCQIAMPETGIGLFPDVGVSFELARAPGETGTYLALTGAVVSARCAQYAGLLDEVPGASFEPSWLEQSRGWIDEGFAGDDAAAILDRLSHHDHPDARAAGELLATRSPLSVAVSLAAIRRAANLPSVAAVLEQDLVLGAAFMRDSDFCEGVRAQLVDKDRAPKWRHSHVADVSRSEVERFFDD